MANGKLSRVHVGLALASAFVVLLASGVAISRISDEDGESPVATGPSSTSSSVPGPGQPGSSVGSGPAATAGTGGVADQAPPASDQLATDESAVDHGVTRTARKAAGNPGGVGSGSSAGTGASTGSGSGSSTGSSGSGGGSSDGGTQDGGQDSPPAPSQEKVPLATAAVSAGEGAQGAVVGVGLGNGEPAEADVTVGTNPVVGDHPPSEGTGISLGGRLLQTPPGLPGLPG